MPKELLQLIIVSIGTILLSPSLDLLGGKGLIYKDVHTVNDSTLAQDVYVTYDYTFNFRIEAKLQDPKDTSTLNLDPSRVMLLHDAKDREYEKEQATSEPYDSTALCTDLPLQKGEYTLYIPIYKKSKMKDINQLLSIKYTPNPSKGEKKDTFKPENYHWYHFYYFNQPLTYSIIIAFFIIISFVLPKFLNKNKPV